MPFDRRSSSSEARPLLEDAPPSYSSVDNLDDDSSIESEPELPPLNKFSRADTCWILAGLWSAVFLGALDGMCYITSWRA